MTKEEISIQITALGVRERIISLLRETADESPFSVIGKVQISGKRVCIGRYPFVEVEPQQVTFYISVVESCPEFKQIKAEIDKFLESYYPNINRRYHYGNIVS